MTDDVAELVLADNEAQTNALEIAAVEAPGLVGVHARQMERLEQTGLLDRALERLPDAKGLQERHAAGLGLTAPELAVLLAFTKLDLQRELVASDVPDDPYLRHDLHDYFPAPVRDRFDDLIDAHALHREITATVVANAVVNRAGISFLSRLADETGAGLPVLARAHIAARDVFDISSTWSAIDDLDLLVPAATQDRMFLAARRLVERGARWLVRHSIDLDLEPTVTRFREPVADVVARLPELVIGADAAAIASEAEQLRADGVPAELARRVATFPAAIGALVIADIAAARGADVDVVGSVFFAVADRLRLDWLRDRIAALPRADRWQTEARAALRDDVADLQRAAHRGRARDDGRRRRAVGARRRVGRRTRRRGRALPRRCSPRSRRVVCSTSPRSARRAESSASCASSAALSRPADGTPHAIGEQRRARRVRPARAVDAAAGMRRRRREEQAAHRRLGSTEPGHRPEHELLRERHRAAAERAADEIGVARFEVRAVTGGGAR